MGDDENPPHEVAVKANACPICLHAKATGAFGEHPIERIEELLLDSASASRPRIVHKLYTNAVNPFDSAFVRD